MLWHGRNRSLVCALLVSFAQARAAETSCPPASLQARMDAATGQVIVTDTGQPVLRYHYRLQEPGDILGRVQPDNRKYAQARSDYIHPLYGLNGEELSRDWSLDHPHHRGIYWAWPEVDYGSERGDLHALQRVFARPTGRCLLQSGAEFAEIDAENEWLWEDREAVVRERAIIWAGKLDASGRCIDLEFHFTALRDGVFIARRGTTLYGGLNLRFALVQHQQITTYCDPPDRTPRMAWADLRGIFASGKPECGVTILQHSANPEAPGDWGQYTE